MAADPHSRSILTLCDIIRETSLEILKYLRSGFNEKIYENSLANRPRKKGVRAEQQHRMKVFDQDVTLLGLLTADLLVDKHLICEIKGCTALIEAHTAQLLGYLRAARIEHGLLINFGAPRLEIKKYILN
jgi:GxxExxY protein